MVNPVKLQGIKLLSVAIEDALSEAISHIPKKNGDYFCFSNIHLVMEGIKHLRPLTKEEDEAYVKQINNSSTDILFVSLGAPKQEKWMYEHKGRIKAVQLGVGAAFSFITGKVKQAHQPASL